MRIIAALYMNILNLFLSIFLNFNQPAHDFIPLIEKQKTGLVFLNFFLFGKFSLQISNQVPCIVYNRQYLLFLLINCFQLRIYDDINVIKAKHFFRFQEMIKSEIDIGIIWISSLF